MRALVSQTEPPFVQLADVPEPLARHDEAVVAVRAVSLNRGESNRLRTMEPGTVTGWDLAGEVVEAAPSGDGPPVGARVVGMLNARAWGQRAAVPVEYLAELPAQVSFEAASTLPVAGVTALRSLELGGFIVGKRVLITGASGGVGRFAIQLARLAGAEVYTVSRRTEGLRELGAAHTLTELEPGEEPAFDVILDGLGGPVLGTCLQRVVPGGLVVSYASTLTDPVSYPTRELFARAPGARLYGLYVFSELAQTRTASADLRRLADLVAAGELDPQIDLTLPWDRAGEAVQALLGRQVAGKAVLTVG